jgi:hypothetical protein
MSTRRINAQEVAMLYAQSMRMYNETSFIAISAHYGAQVKEDGFLELMDQYPDAEVETYTLGSEVSYKYEHVMMLFDIKFFTVSNKTIDQMR